MPSIFQHLILLLAVASLQFVAHARPTHVDPAESSVRPDGEPASLLGRQFLHIHQNKKRIPLILMDPALNKGFQTPNANPSSLSAEPGPSKKAKKVKSREQPMPFARFLSRDSDVAVEVRSTHERGDTQPVSYLSNTNPSPPAAPAPPTIQAPPPPTPPVDPYSHFRPYGPDSLPKPSKNEDKKKDDDSGLDKDKSKIKDETKDEKKGEKKRKGKGKMM